MSWRLTPAFFMLTIMKLKPKIQLLNSQMYPVLHGQGIYRGINKYIFSIVGRQNFLKMVIFKEVDFHYWSENGG